MLQLSSGTLILLIVFLLSFIARLYFHFRYFLFFTRKEQSITSNNEGVSVIIAAKNEADNLENFIPKILNQYYLNFEVIVINDHSTDETEKVLQSLTKGSNKLKYYSLEQGYNGKKAALQKGIKMAKFDVFLFTDADCQPSTNLWIQYMMNAKTTRVELVLGYGRHKKEEGWLNKVIRYDTLLTGIKYLSFANKGEAYMAVGRNYLYTRNLFNSSTSFQVHKNIPYGDDDLFANEMANYQNTATCMDLNAHTISIPKKNWYQFFLQKIRHLKVGTLYKKSDKFILTLEWASKLFLFLSAAILLFLGIWEILLLIFIDLILQHIGIYGAVKKLGDRDLLKYAAILELVHMCFISFCGVYSLINKKVNWK